MNSKWNTVQERLPLSKEAVVTYEIPGSIFEEGEAGRVAVIDSVQKARELAFVFNQKGKEISASEIYVAALLKKSYGLIYAGYLKGVSGKTPFDTVQTSLFDDSHSHFQEVFSGYRNYFISMEKMGENIDLLTVSPSGEFIKEMISLDLLNANPALNRHKELFDDSRIQPQAFYRKDQKEIKQLFKTLPLVGQGENAESLIDFLLRPIEKYPHSLIDQLKFATEYWREYLGDFLPVLIGALDLMAEETKPRFLGPGEPQGIDFSFEDKANYSQDSNWMPRVVLLAKNALVWLDQLSKKYKSSIVTLADIPDAELDLLAKRGFSSLWLIGIWNRSKASQRIKVICGNPEAEASAYSLYDYEISGAVGGDKAFQDLDIRCKARGIRLASDMVPNHTGMDSKWVREHPDYFLRLDYSPMPQYSFNGEDLCEDPYTQVFLEDHYYDKSDCAVVFKRRNVNSGEEQYIYHGNDGTAMPWNDTAQINFLNPEAREAVIGEILKVARKFSIIRFDAAMTLAKKHIQRLWFPEPGSGGDISTRSEHAMSRVDFEKAIPEEFWQEVVNRIAQEVPNTLLLAEAFWMMEGYFVRNLGMHRVYNSAFMNMLKMERNKDYRDTVKNTLNYDEQILKRYVNFMNNPDEDTAVAQFGKGDKYFGVCVLLSTMPGLPMFGHGQLEGFEEKYGMEYRKAYWDESQDEDLIRRHEQTIFPLLKKRFIFSEVEKFAFYDFYTPDHILDENVFAYSNDYKGEKSLVLYNNCVCQTSGWIKESVNSRVCISDDESYERNTSLWKAFGLIRGVSRFCIFKENISGFWYIRYSDEILHGGIYFELNGYEANVFLSIQEVEDNTRRGIYKELHNRLDGKGTLDIFKDLRKIKLEPVYSPLDRLLGSDFFGQMALILSPEDLSKDKLLSKTILTELKSIKNIFREIYDISLVMERDALSKSLPYDQLSSEEETSRDLTGEAIQDDSFDDLIEKVLNKFVKALMFLSGEISKIRKRQIGKAVDFLSDTLLFSEDVSLDLYLRLVVADLLEGLYGADIVRNWDLCEKFNEFFPLKCSRRKTEDLRFFPVDRVVSSFDDYGNCIELKDLNDPTTLFLKLYSGSLKDIIGINLYDEKLWFNKEMFETEMANIYFIGGYSLAVSGAGVSDFKQWAIIVQMWFDCAEQSNYLIENLLRLI